MLSLVVDAPKTLAAAGTHPIARLDTFHDRRYGDFSITQEDYAEWKKKLANVFGGRVPIDPDHVADTPGGSTEAYGWITGLTLASDEHGQRVDATIEWNDKGEDAIKNDRYRYISPTFVDHLAGEQGQDLGKALLGAGLTNRPFLRRGMPPITLSAGQAQAERQHLIIEAQEETEKTVDPAVTTLHAHVVPQRADSHPVNPLLKKLSQALGLAEDATEDQVVTTAKTLAASPLADTKALAKTLELAEDATGEQIVEKVTTLSKAEPAKPDTGLKTLAEQAAEEGKVVLSAEDAAKLLAGAAAGERAATTLDDRDFEDAFATAAARGAVDAKAETKKLHRDIYDADKELGLKALANLPDGSVHPARPKGAGGGDAMTLAAGADSVTLAQLAGESLALDEEQGEVALKALSAATADGKELTLESFEAALAVQDNAGMVI